jgi:hypothetical protein
MSIIIVANKKYSIELYTDSQETSYSNNVTYTNKITEFSCTKNNKDGTSIVLPVRIADVGNKAFISGFTNYLIYHDFIIDYDRSVIDNIRVFIADFLDWSSRKKIDYDFSAILIVDEEVYNITGIAVEKIDVGNYKCLGSGDQYAIGAMEACNDVKKAIEIACSQDVYCGGPINKIEIQKN